MLSESTGRKEKLVLCIINLQSLHMLNLSCYDLFFSYSYLRSPLALYGEV